jgi:hypothetical protein
VCCVVSCETARACPRLPTLSVSFSLYLPAAPGQTFRSNVLAGRLPSSMERADGRWLRVHEVCLSSRRLSSCAL